MLNGDFLGAYIFHLKMNIILQVVTFYRNIFMPTNNQNVMNPILRIRTNYYQFNLNCGYMADVDHMDVYLLYMLCMCFFLCKIFRVTDYPGLPRTILVEHQKANPGNLSVSGKLEQWVTMYSTKNFYFKTK